MTERRSNARRRPAADRGPAHTGGLPARPSNARLRGPDEVRATVTAPAPTTSQIATLDQLKARLNKTRSTDDDELQEMLDGATARVESFTGRSFHTTPPLEANGADSLPEVTIPVPFPSVWAAGRSEIWPDSMSLRPRRRKLTIPDAREITAVSFSGATVASWEPIGDQYGDPPYGRLQLNGLLITCQDWTAAPPSVSITGRFGIWPAPADVVDAVLTMAARRWREREAQWGDQVQTPEGGVVNYFREFPVTVQATLTAYQRKAGLR